MKEQGLQVEEGEGGGGDDTKSTFANQSTAQAHGDGDTATTTTVTGADTEKLERELKKARQEAELLKKQLKEVRGHIEGHQWGQRSKKVTMGSKVIQRVNIGTEVKEGSFLGQT